jgi:hypothetical protein
MTGAGVGAAAGGPVGAIVGDVVADSLFQQGKSGAVKIGISPTVQQTLSQALDEYDTASPAKRKSLEPGIYQQIIRFRSKLAKGMDEDERHDLERRVAAYSNSLVKRK